MSTYEISKSSLLSLKAEILRKQQELTKAKADNEVKIKVIRKNTPLEIKNKGVEARINNDISEEEQNLLKKSRTILEAKSKLYDKLSSGNKSLTESEREIKNRLLVRFDKKSRVGDLPPSYDENDVDKYPESEEEMYHSDEESKKDSGNEWVDYVDFLGRTRKCLRKDLDFLKSQDNELRKTLKERRGREDDIKDKNYKDNDKTESPSKENENESEKLSDEEQINLESELLSSDMRRELLRKQWEKEEEELANKSDVHYQDILFGEARSHGVGYYGFSKDEEERKQQLNALNKLREETQEKQRKAQELKAMREKQLAARVKAAKNRKRARLGLPPEEEPEPTPQPTNSEEENKTQLEQKQQQEEKEKLLEEARRRHLRPWDIGKEGVKEHYEMTQEEWMEKKRKERPKEFAPPRELRKEFRSKVKEFSVDESSKSLNFTTKKNKFKSFENENSVKGINPYKNSRDYEEIPQGGVIEPTPIENLCDFEDRLLADHTRSLNNEKQNTDLYSDESSDSSDNEERGKGVEIAPPPTFDYYGPGPSKKTKSSGINNINDSIEAGLKFLRKQVESRDKSNNHPEEMFLS